MRTYSKRVPGFRAVLRAIRSHLTEPLAIKQVVSDFEAALLRSIPSVFGFKVQHRGCVFHWTQAVWRKVQACGLASAYMERDDVHRYCRRLMSLPFLPAAEIEPAFQRIKSRAQWESLLKLVCTVELFFFL